MQPIPDEVIIFIEPAPTTDHDTRNCSYFSVPYARTNAYYYSFFPHVMFLELPPTVAQAPSSSVFKRLIFKVHILY